MSRGTASDDYAPPSQYLPARDVITEIAKFGQHRIEELSSIKILVLGIMGGAFITAGALFSILLGSGFDTVGARVLVEGIGFSTGFFFVILAEAALFSEANVVMPAALFQGISPAARVFRFWGLALVGNLAGAIITGWLMQFAQVYSPEFDASLAEIVAFKMSYREIGGAEGWFKLILSGMLANWLVGMAAFFATMGKTIVGKYVPVLLAVSLFVAAGFQHSPANMGYFSLSMAAGGDPGWGPAIAWNLIPAGIGNILGGTLLVALPFWYLYGRTKRPMTSDT
ncbi:MAG: formate/nitrite transporter family protein [Acidimicrobiia bacterium]|nr:MAG: formate/nitrite transporter family protein [Acidimicrobiia bacterium]